jgi:hypothetical protein
VSFLDLACTQQLPACSAFSSPMEFSWTIHPPLPNQLHPAQLLLPFLNIPPLHLAHNTSYQVSVTVQVPEFPQTRTTTFLTLKTSSAPLPVVIEASAISLMMEEHSTSPLALRIPAGSSIAVHAVTIDSFASSIPEASTNNAVMWGCAQGCPNDTHNLWDLQPCQVDDGSLLVLPTSNQNVFEFSSDIVNTGFMFVTANVTESQTGFTTFRFVRISKSIVVFIFILCFCQFCCPHCWSS